MQEKNKVPPLLASVTCFVIGFALIFLSVAVQAGTSIDGNGNTTHTIKVGAMDQIQIAIGRGYLSANCGQLPEACSKDMVKAVEDGTCLPADTSAECQAKMDARSLPVNKYKPAGIQHGICTNQDTRLECNAKMEARAVKRARRLQYPSLNKNEVDESGEPLPDNGGDNFEFCMSSELQDDGTTLYGSLSDGDCFRFAVTKGQWPHPAAENIPKLNSAGKWAQFAARKNDGVFRADGIDAWAQRVVDMTGSSDRNGKLKEPEEAP